MGLRRWLGLKKYPEAPNVDWLKDHEFTNDWALSNLARWEAALAPFRADIRQVLEIGSWEGLSALCFLRLLPNAHITCIDTFEGSPEHVDRGVDTSKVEQRFDRNTSAFRDRITKIKSRSVVALDALGTQSRRFDLIYIDGDHRRDAVLADTVLAWPLLNVGGVLIWDDVKWGRDKPGADRPEGAVKLFYRAFSNCIASLQQGRQVMVRKTRDWPRR